MTPTYQLGDSISQVYTPFEELFRIVFIIQECLLRPILISTLPNSYISELFSRNCWVFWFDTCHCNKFLKPIKG
ncbi:hypothetical protein Sjap_008894 [Stephania japonica]|uniref:Uncharacterized protein n=1 Tax=Stephania japonica TaxID=461633 RepID=A0AAP0JSR0_9MAGN